MEKESFCTARPPFLEQLVSLGCLSPRDLQHTDDRFHAVTKSIAELLESRGIFTFPNDRDQETACRLFFDDWYLYAVPHAAGYVYSLYKMREQEFDARNGLVADGDTPGVTVSFIAFETEMLADCIANSSFASLKALNQEINRVVSRRGQRHHPALKAYFSRLHAQGPYLIAECYVSFIAGLAQNGCISVPLHYAAIHQAALSPKATAKVRRLPRFLAANNEAAGYPVCDHERIFLRTPGCLTVFEKNAILATHTANTSFYSFAAEVQYHARFLVGVARLPIPFLGRSLYDSAIRADMTIGDAGLEGPAPFHNPNSRWVRRQQECHRPLLEAMEGRPFGFPYEKHEEENGCGLKQNG